MTFSWARSYRAFTACFLGLFLLLGGATPGFSFALTGYRWPDGTQIAMHLQLAHVSSALQDGSASWNDSATDALNLWNQNVDTVQFVAAEPAGSSGSDGANDVLFSNTVYGESWPTNALAVTLKISSQGSILTETDVLFNDNLKWDSYRGPLQGSGLTRTYDFHRVALHEFGHVLGLDHPDSRGQNVVALMNSIISDLDSLADDDIAGAQYLYPARLTSSTYPPPGRSGDDFSYRITANNNPSSFAATGLPPGLSLNSTTGLITGRCPTSGKFPVDVTAQGRGSATGRVQITIDPLPIYSSAVSQVQIGDAISYQIVAGNNPTAFDATGLPAGLRVDPATGLISGVCQVSGDFPVHVTARSTTSEAAMTVYFYVLPARITSTWAAPIDLGDSFFLQITATNHPRAFSASNLPAGLQLDSGTGVISGTPTTAGYFPFTIGAQTDYGPAQATIYLQVLPPRITSNAFLPAQDIGSTFTFQITASNHPYHFTATGLPPGLQIDPVTGEITGVLELSGRYQVQVTAEGTTGTATATLTINSAVLDVPDVPVTKLALSINGSIVADPQRPRVYVASHDGVAVIDTNSLSVVQTVPVSLFLSDLHISADGNKLWVTNYLDSTIKVIDLNSLSVSATITTSLNPGRIREGADGRLYVTDRQQSDVFQVDATTGATLSQFSPRNPNYGGPTTIEMSPDRKTIYVLVQSQTTPLASYAIVAGGPPQLVQRVETQSAQDYYHALAVNPDGKSLSVISRLPQTLDPTLVRSTADLNVVQGSLASASFPTEIAYNFDGSLLFQAMEQRSRIDVFQTATSQLARTITLPEHAFPADENDATQSMAVDRTNSYFFVTSNTLTPGFPGPAVYVYSLTPPPRPQTPAKSLLNVSTRLRALPGDNALIGGFIVKGQAPKQLALRAIGPSLPISGKLADPVLQLFDSSGAMIAQNDNWNAHRADVIAASVAPLDERDAVVVTTVQPGSYTAVVRGLNDSSGVALVEAYDLSPDSASKLANVSTRGKVEIGDNVMIGGFILGGDQFTNVVVRAIGPSLANFGIGGALTDPMLEVHDGNGALIAQDDDWRMYQEQQLIQAGLAPTDDRESAMLLFLQPGAYTAIVRGKDNATGVGLVEVYNLDAN